MGKSCTLTRHAHTELDWKRGGGESSPQSAAPFAQGRAHACLFVMPEGKTLAAMKQKIGVII